MAIVVWWILTLALVAVFAWNLGVRRERGRQAKLEEVQQAMTAEAKRRKGTRLRSIRVRR